jgi:hypothetical protein
MGSISFGTTLVTGANRVPCPAAGIKAFMRGILPIIVIVYQVWPNQLFAVLI